MELEQIALLDMLHDVIENLEWSVHEVEQLRQSAYSGPDLRRHHLADRPESTVRRSFLHTLRQRVASLTREPMRKNKEHLAISTRDREQYHNPKSRASAKV